MSALSAVVLKSCMCRGAKIKEITYTKDAQPVDSVAYGYDSVGFINSVTRAGAELLIPSISNASHDAANRMTEFNGKPLTYDKSGNVLDMGIQLNVWNQKGQLIHVTGARGGTITYKYDALGRRVEKDVAGVITIYLYDGLDLIAEMDAARTVKAWYVHGGPIHTMDRPLARIASDGTVHYYHADILGSVIALTDANGAVTTTYRYSPFGETVVEGTDISQPFRFTGREWDAETGLYYYRARYYSPEMKRFITEDPIRYASSEVNWYAYAGNNPISFTDPLGLYAGDGFDDAFDDAYAYEPTAPSPCDLPPPPEGRICPAKDVTFAEELKRDWKMFNMDYGGNAHKMDILVGDYIAPLVYVSAGSVALGVEASVMSQGNVCKIISKRFKSGFRIDPAHHGKPWGHSHFWRW